MWFLGLVGGVCSSCVGWCAVLVVCLFLVVCGLRFMLWFWGGLASRSVLWCTCWW